MAGPRPGILFSFAAVTTARLGLRWLGLRRTARLVRRIVRVIGRATPRGQPLEVARRVATVAAFFPGRAVCLEQSVALYLVLRRFGHPAALRIGVQALPFVAHAWIEIDGAPLFEGEATGTSLTPFPEVLA